MHRPWGKYTVLHEAPQFKVKRIEVNPGKKLSLQMHHKRSEHWVVVRGSARVTVGERSVDLGPNESIYVPMQYQTPDRERDGSAVDDRRSRSAGTIWEKTTSFAFRTISDGPEGVLARVMEADVSTQQATPATPVRANPTQCAPFPY